MTETEGQARTDERELIPVWLVWESGKSLRGEKVLALRGINTTPEQAEKQKGQVEGFTYIREQTVWIEKVALDHLFGHEDMIEAVAQMGRVRKYKQEREGD